MFQKGNKIRQIISSSLFKKIGVLFCIFLIVIYHKAKQLTTLLHMRYISKSDVLKVKYCLIVYARILFLTQIHYKKIENSTYNDM